MCSPENISLCLVSYAVLQNSLLSSVLVLSCGTWCLYWWLNFQEGNLLSWKKYLKLKRKKCFQMSCIMRKGVFLWCIVNEFFNFFFFLKWRINTDGSVIVSCEDMFKLGFIFRLWDGKRCDRMVLSCFLARGYVVLFIEAQCGFLKMETEIFAQLWIVFLYRLKESARAGAASEWNLDRDRVCACAWGPVPLARLWKHECECECDWSEGTDDTCRGRLPVQRG